MTSIKLSTLAAAALLCAIAAQASPLHNLTGLSGTFATENFDSNAGDGSAAAAQFAGMTFGGGNFVNNGFNGVFPNMVKSVIANFVSPSTITSPTSVSFAAALSEAAFAFVSNPQDMTFDAYLGAGLVESSTYATGLNGDFYGFTGITFDRIVITGDSTGNNAYILDSLQTKAAAVPEPGMLALLGLAGLGALVASRRRRAA